MKPRDLDAAAIDALQRDSGAEELEVFLKRGRSRRLVREGVRQTQTEADEQGWAVRASKARGSFFVCGTGAPGRDHPWPQADGYPLALPRPGDSGSWQAPSHADAPLASEAELRALARAVRKELERAIPSARVDLVVLEDGQSESRIGNSLGLLSGWRTRLASLTLRASVGEPRAVSVGAEWVRPELREMSPRSLAGRLANLLAVRSEGRTIARDRCEVVVAPEVATRLIEGLLPLFAEAAHEELVTALGGSRLGSPLVSLLDDGRLDQGLLSSPVDGEGSATREVVLIEEGSVRQPLVPWSSDRPGWTAGGCSRRNSWREQPRVGPSHLYLRPDMKIRAAELVSGLSRGYYLLDVTGPGEFRFSADRFELPVCGFELLGGRARAPVSDIRIVGKISGLLGGVRAVARDLTFVRGGDGLIGSPTLRLAGLELRG